MNPGVVEASFFGVLVTVTESGVTVRRAWWAAHGARTVFYPFGGITGVEMRHRLGFRELVIRTADGHDVEITVPPGSRGAAFDAVRDAIAVRVSRPLWGA